MCRLPNVNFAESSAQKQAAAYLWCLSAVFLCQCTDGSCRVLIDAQRALIKTGSVLTVPSMFKMDGKLDSTDSVMRPQIASPILSPLLCGSVQSVLTLLAPMIIFLSFKSGFMRSLNWFEFPSSHCFDIDPRTRQASVYRLHCVSLAVPLKPPVKKPPTVCVAD